MRRLDMATSYPNPTNQNDLMPAMYEPYSNMVYQNYPSSGPYSDPIADSSRAQHSLIELPISASMLSQEAPACGSDVADSHAWGGRKHVIDPHVDGRIMSFPASNIHGLSLSLGRHHPLHSLHYRASDSDISYLGSHQSSARNNLYSRERNIYYESTSSVPFTKSKYLKAAQELLEEVVNVQTALKQKREKTHSSTALGENDLNLKSNMMHQNSGTSAAERQDKLTKLLYMLDEVDQRYKQYYKEMQAVVSSFDQVAGLGAAQPYMAVALQTISRHFRSLRDAIDGQIRAINMGQGEFERHGHADLADGGIHRLRFIDQKLRPERNLQHFGMVPQHSWRPQRGLPETSVSILRAWLFEHFLHPYPKDSDKLFLARQTGLTRNQVSNWFINARVRLWKPMVEEMYKEEFAGGGSNNCDRDSNSDGGGDGGDGVGSGGGGSCGKSPSLNSPVEGPPLDERGASPEESALLMLRQALIRADSSGGVSLSLGLHQGSRRQSATNGGQKLPAAPERVSGVAACDGSGLGPSLDYDCLHLVERQQRIGSSQLLHDFVV